MAESLTLETSNVLEIARLAGQRIAPNWPLDQMIAVNPLWEMRDRPFSEVAANMSLLGGIYSLMPPKNYRAYLQQGDISQDSLQQQVEQAGFDLDQFLNDSLEAVPNPWNNIADLIDENRSVYKMSWSEELVQEISQFCAAHYQETRPILGKNKESHFPNLYAHWLRTIKANRGIGVLMHEPELTSVFQILPTDAETLFEQAIVELELSDSMLGDYFHSLLLDVNGWASYVAYLRWQANFANEQQDDMLQLLAIRLAWELAIWRYTKDHHTKTFQWLTNRWQKEKQSLETLRAAHHDYQKKLEVWAKALEQTQQQKLKEKLIHHSNRVTPSPPRPTLQAAFCIDVRSEIIRRALESCSEEIETQGFAGFFGLPINYQPANTFFKRPQLPGLLPPAITAQEVAVDDKRHAQLNKEARWQRWTKGAASSFSMVETVGWSYLFKLVKKSFLGDTTEHPIGRLSHQTKWRLKTDEGELNSEEKAKLAQAVLQALQISDYAETVMLVGHGSCTSNNLHAAGLDCGACGGQTGEVNVRALSWLLNDEQVRAELQKLGVTIPEDTRFVAALHNTTTDHISVFDDQVDAKICAWLDQATQIAQRERAPALNIKADGLSGKKLDKLFQNRSQDWSQTRPEWGLANNQAFIIAPRSFTRGLNLGGRVFLHDYDYKKDQGYGLLEVLMTAPMIVTHWINMQYNMSVTDNRKYGSGNKVLHNAVGGNIGVFEGNGGDLRIGLSLQSVHDGKQWMHTPQRLMVVIAAPESVINNIVEKHEVLQQLIKNQWLYVYSWQNQLTLIQ